MDLYLKRVDSTSENDAVHIPVAGYGPAVLLGRGSVLGIADKRVPRCVNIAIKSILMNSDRMN